MCNKNQSQEIYLVGTTAFIVFVFSRYVFDNLFQDVKHLLHE